MKFGKREIVGAALSTLVLLGIVMLKHQGNMARKVHQQTGLENGVLNPCPNSPNCVSSMYPEDVRHYKPAWSYTVSRSEALSILKGILKQHKHTAIVCETNSYLHLTFTTPFFRFIDDVEFYLPESDGVIHFRSASRVGYYDLGANARRLRKLRTQFDRALQQKER
jgi:uncharacterized protein (DUF1499 family)